MLRRFRRYVPHHASMCHKTPQHRGVTTRAAPQSTATQFIRCERTLRQQTLNSLTASAPILISMNQTNGMHAVDVTDVNARYAARKWA